MKRKAKIEKHDLKKHFAAVHEGKKPSKCESCDHGLTAGTSKSPSVSMKPKICKSTWHGTKCLVKNCANVHIAPCQDRECLALDGGLPLYKTRDCFGM